jgi:hypothetical protein
MGAPHSDITGQDKQSLSPKAAALEKVVRKNHAPLKLRNIIVQK